MDTDVDGLANNDGANLSDEDDNQKTEFVLKWCKNFPGVEIPKLKFFDDSEAEQRLNACRNLIKHLEEKLNQKKFYLLFLQAYLNDKKKANFQEPRNLNSNCSSSYKTDDAILSPCRDSIDNTFDFKKRNNLSAKENIYVVNNVQLNCIETNNGGEMRPNCSESDSKSSTLLSSVLEDVGRFETNSNSSGSPVIIHERSSRATKPNTNKAPYIEVWECSTGIAATRKAIKATPKEDSNLQVMQASDAFENLAPSKNKPLLPNRRIRHDYEEVWTCSSGIKRIPLNSAEETSSDKSPSRNLSIDEYIEELENQQEYIIEDLKIEKSLKTESPKPKLRNKGIPRNKPARNRNNWRSALPVFQV